MYIYHKFAGGKIFLKWKMYVYHKLASGKILLKFSVCQKVLQIFFKYIIEILLYKRYHLSSQALFIRYWCELKEPLFFLACIFIK